MTGFAQLLREAEVLADGLALDVPETWHQGRTAYGGFSSALALAVAQKVGGGNLPPLRSAQLAMMAPVNGRVEVCARIERAGRNATWISTRIMGEKGPAFTASFAFMGMVESELHLNERPAPDALIGCDQARPVFYSRHTPAFLVNNFECRRALPASEEKRPELCRWVRLADQAELDPMVEMLLVGDALPPGVMPMLHVGVPVSTMHWQINLLTSLPVTRDGWWLLRSVGDYAEKGCSSQRMAIWNTGGEPVLAGMQSIALFG